MFGVLGGIGNIAEIKIVFKKNKSTGTTTKATATAAAPTITSRARWEEGKEAKVGKKISVE